MSQPVKLSDHLVLDARVIAEESDRSIAGQIEFWAGLGRAIEPLLQGDKALALRRAGKQQKLSELLSTVSTPKGKQRVLQYLAGKPFPHYEPAPESPGYLIRIEKSGKRTLGRFVNRKFVAVRRNTKRQRSGER